MAAQPEQRNSFGFPTGSEPVSYAWDDSREGGTYWPLLNAEKTEAAEPQIGRREWMALGWFIAAALLGVLLFPPPWAWLVWLMSL